MNGLLKKIVILAVLIFCGVAIKNMISPKVTDVTYWVNMEKQELEDKLGYLLPDAPGMVPKIYAYTDGEVTVDGDSKNGFGIVYIDGKQSGLHIDGRKYGMFGLRTGLSNMEVDELLTYDYETVYEVLNDIGQGSSTATFYQNYTKGDCLVVVFNDLSGRVVAITYYTDGERATERLSF